MAGFARLWTTFTGRRVIGLTTSTNAARVLAHEGLAESYNIAEFLGKTEGSDELRRPVPCTGTTYSSSTRPASSARPIWPRCRRRPGRPERGWSPPATPRSSASSKPEVCSGCSCRRSPPRQLHEVRRFDAAWEREASIRLRDGDLAAVAVYDRHGRIRGADADAAYDRAATMWLADHLRGKDVLLLAGSNAEAAGLSRRVQAKLAQLGIVGPPQVPLSDGNHAGVGDLVRARLNTEIDAGGGQLTNRDTLHVTAFRGPDAAVRRRRLDGTWTGTFRVPRSYLARHAELAYAGNVHLAQGRTVDTAHLLVTGTSVPPGPVRRHDPRPPGQPRARRHRTTAPPGHQPYQQATPEAVLASILQRDDGDLSATEQIRQAQEQSGGTGHLLTLWSAAVRQTLHPGIDEQIKARLTESEAWRYDREHARQALQRRLRAAQLAGHDIGALVERITAAPMDQARSIASVLYHRLQRLALPRLAARRHLGPAHPRQRPRRSPTSSPPRSTTGPARSANSWPLALSRGSPATSASCLPARLPRCARNTPAARAPPPPPTGKPPGSPTPTRPSHPSRTAATPNSKPCARQYSPPWRSATRPTSSAAWTAANSKPQVLRGCTRPRRRPAGRQQLSCGSPRKPKPTPSGKSADARSPARPHRRGQRCSPRRADGRRTPAARSRRRPIRAMVRRHPRHQGRSRESRSRTATAGTRPAR